MNWRTQGNSHNDDKGQQTVDRLDSYCDAVCCYWDSRYLVHREQQDTN